MSKSNSLQKAQLVRTRLLATNCKLTDPAHPMDALHAEINHIVTFLPVPDKADFFTITAETTLLALDQKDKHEVLSLNSKIGAEFKINDKKAKISDFEKESDIFASQIYLATRIHVVGILNEMGLNGAFMPFSLAAQFKAAKKNLKEGKEKNK